MILQAEDDSDVIIDMACKKALFRLVVMEFRGLRISYTYMYVDVWQKQKNKL